MPDQRDYRDPDDAYDRSRRRDSQGYPADRADYDTRRSSRYDPDRYTPSNVDDRGRDTYDRDGGRSRDAGDRYDARDSDRYDAYDDRRDARRSQSGRRDRSRAADEYDDEGYAGERSLERYDRDRPASRRSRGSRGGGYSRSPSSERPRSHRGVRALEEHFGREKKDIAATVIGALAGGFLAHEASGGKRPLGTVGGAVLGGLAGNAIEHRHLRRKEEKEEREREREMERRGGHDYDYD